MHSISGEACNLFHTKSLMELILKIHKIFVIYIQYLITELCLRRQWQQKNRVSKLMEVNVTIQEPNYLFIQFIILQFS
jgi:hypothetical protein